MKTSRRNFLKATTAAATAAAVSRFGPGILIPKDAEGQVASIQGENLVEEWVPTTCWIGKQDCGILARRINGRVVNLVGHPDHPRNRGTLCPKGVAQIMALYDPNRVKAPLMRTNEKGVSGKWKQVSWDEALTLVGEKIKEVKSRDRRLLIWQKGRSKAKKFYDEAFVKSSGATKLHHGAMCSDAAYRACEYTIGLHAGMHPDFRHTRYLLSWGWNITAGGGNKLCWLTWPQQLIEARERGLKVVNIDPRLRSAGPFSDEWLPIRPSTDLALALALCHMLIEQDTIDRDYLKKYTNAPFLVKEDGFFLRVDNKEQVWDAAAQAAKPSDTQNGSPTLEGEFTVSGSKVKPAFQVFKEHVAQYTPEWAADVCGLPAEQIRKVAKELGENAMIGSTIVVDGVTLPYRPVAIMTYHIAQQELGFQLVRAQLMVMMLLGAVGAVGGTMSDFTWKIHKNYEGMDNIKITETPNIYLNKSKFFPINSNNSSLVAKVMLDPEKYGVDYTPEVLIVHMANPIVSFVIDPWLSKTADLFADVVLPAATLEKYEGPLSVTDQYTDATALRIPPMEPLFQSRGDIDIYLDLCEKADILYGKNGYLDQLNKALKFKEPYSLPLDKKPTVRDIFDRWAKSEGIKEGVAYFEKNGVKIKGPIPPQKRYGYATDPPFGGVIHRLYGESLLRYRDEMRQKGVDEIYWRDYLPLPTWRPLTMDSSPKEYDLFLISYKLLDFKQSRTPFALVRELAPKQIIDINPETAKAKGIEDGDDVWVESHNAVTGETRKVKVTTRYGELIRPDTVAMPHHYGEQAQHPWTKKEHGPTPNALFFTGEGYVTNTADQTFHVKVRIYKA
jgi:anaerobic selenocysteine-containing dehydrogenase